MTYDPMCLKEEENHTGTIGIEAYNRKKVKTYITQKNNYGKSMDRKGKPLHEAGSEGAITKNG
jgi:hypothetical protein